MSSPTLKPEFSPLLPAGFHARSMQQVRAEFVTADRFALSSTRDVVMGGLERIVETLGACPNLFGELWLDGSFVTEKIDPEDIDYLLCVPSDLYDTDPAVRTVVDWESVEERQRTHYCDAYKWIQYKPGHPLFRRAEAERIYWTRWFGHSRSGLPKGIVVVSLPAVLT